MPATDDAASAGFLARWSRRKALVRQGAPVAEPAVPPAAPEAAPAPVHTAAAPAAPAEAPRHSTALPDVPPSPTLADVAALTQDSDFTRFVVPGVDVGVKNAALKKLFTAPHFNVMDGLDTYIDDYGQPDPLPAGMLRQMAQSQALGLFADDPPEPAPPPAVAVAAALSDPDPLQDASSDENPDLRLQPHDAAGPASPGPCLEPYTGGEHRRD